MPAINTIVIDPEPDTRAGEVTPGISDVDIDGVIPGIVPLTGEQRIGGCERYQPGRSGFPGTGR